MGGVRDVLRRKRRWDQSSLLSWELGTGGSARGNEDKKNTELQEHIWEQEEKTVPQSTPVQDTNGWGKCEKIERFSRKHKSRQKSATNKTWKCSESF